MRTFQVLMKRAFGVIGVANGRPRKKRWLTLRSRGCLGLSLAPNEVVCWEERRMVVRSSRPVWA